MNIRWKEVAEKLWEEAATACGVTSGEYKKKIQITICHTFNTAPSVISIFKLLCRLIAFCCYT